MRPAFLPALLALAACATTPTDPMPNETTSRSEPAAVVARLYDLVTFGPGQAPDWDEVRALFVDEAVIVLRTGREEMTVFSVDGFVDDFVRFIERAEVEATGFTERILDLRETVYRDIAQILVRFDSHIPGSGRPPTEGLDSFELVRRDDGWKIVSVVNERPTAELPIPDELFDD